MKGGGSPELGEAADGGSPGLGEDADGVRPGQTVDLDEYGGSLVQGWNNDGNILETSSNIRLSSSHQLSVTTSQRLGNGSTNHKPGRTPTNHRADLMLSNQKPWLMSTSSKPSLLSNHSTDSTQVMHADSTQLYYKYVPACLGKA